MRIGFAVSVLALSLALALPVAATEKLSCDDLAGIQASLKQVSDALGSMGMDKVKEDGEIDKALNQLVEGLNIVAASENDSALSDSVRGMTEGWESMDGDLFMNSMNQTHDRLDEIYQKDCR